MSSRSAPPQTAPGAAAPVRQFLTFSLDGELFAIAIVRIKEIIEYGTLTTVPMMPPFIRGVINLRGSVVPVVDLQARFGRPASKVSRRSCVVILELDTEEERQQIGVLVDSVSEVLELPESEIEPPPAFGAAVRPDFIEGMGKIGGRFVILLDLSRVLSSGELAAVAEAGGEACAA